MRLAKILLVEYSKAHILSYFSQVVLENIQGFVSIDRVYRIITQSKHCSRSEEREERLRHRVSNLRLLNS